MTADIVSTGLLTLPNAMAVVGAWHSVVRVLRSLKCADVEDVRAGIVPSLILTIFLGMFALFTAKLLVDFKLNHPEVHSMGRFRAPSFACPPLMFYR